MTFKDVDVLIVDRTHLAVALYYNRNEHKVPIIVGKGKEAVALEMSKSAKLSHIHISQYPALAKKLYELEMGDGITEELYAAVAEILAYVYNKDRQRLAPYLKVRGAILYQKEIRA